MWLLRLNDFCFVPKLISAKKNSSKKTPLANFRVRIETENKGRHAKPVPAALWFSRWRWNFFLFRQSTQKLFRCHLFADILFKFNFKGAFNKFLPSGKFNQTSICYIYTALNRFGFCLLQNSLYEAPLNDAQPRDRLVLLSFATNWEGCDDTCHSLHHVDHFTTDYPARCTLRSTI